MYFDCTAQIHQLICNISSACTGVFLFILTPIYDIVIIGLTVYIILLIEKQIAHFMKAERFFYISNNISPPPPQTSFLQLRGYSATNTGGSRVFCSKGG